MESCEGRITGFRDVMIVCTIELELTIQNRTGDGANRSIRSPAGNKYVSNVDVGDNEHSWFQIQTLPSLNAPGNTPREQIRSSKGTPTLDMLIWLNAYYVHCPIQAVFPATGHTAPSPAALTSGCP
jgi:hypothetical protein